MILYSLFIIFIVCWFLSLYWNYYSRRKFELLLQNITENKIYRSIINISMEIITCRRQNCTTKGWSTNGCLTAPLPHRSMANLVSHSRSTASGFGSPPCFYASTFPRKKKEWEREKKDMVKATHRWRSVTLDRWIHIYRIYIRNIFKWLDEQYIHLTNYSFKISTKLKKLWKLFIELFIHENLWKFMFIINLENNFCLLL